MPCLDVEEGLAVWSERRGKYQCCGGGKVMGRENARYEREGGREVKREIWPVEL